MLRKCKVHGLTEYRTEKSKDKIKYRCIKCGVLAVRKRSLKFKLLAVEYKGGKCEICGYDKYVGALEFHHRDPSKKDFGIGTCTHGHSLNEIKRELDKCDLLCSNCHREKHGLLV